MILENVRPLINDRLGGIRVNARLQIRVVRLDDLGQLVRQVILGTLVIICDDGGANLGWRDGQHRADHPIRAAPEATETHEVHILICDAAEQAENILHLERLLLLHRRILLT